MLDLNDTQIDMMLIAAIQKIPETKQPDDSPKEEEEEETPARGQFPPLKAIARNRKHCLKQNSRIVKFTMSSPGCIKIGMLKKFMDNGVLDNIDMLFLDAPDADLDPGMIPAVVDLLLKLDDAGVQIFLATNNCLFVRYLQACSSHRHNVRYHSLYPKKFVSSRICSSGICFSRVEETPLKRDFFHLIYTISKSEMRHPEDLEDEEMEEMEEEAPVPEIPEPPLSSKLRI